MRKIFEFTIKSNKIKVANSWSGGIKLYVNGDCKDFDSSLFCNEKTALLSAQIKDHGILEIFPKSGLISVEMDAFLVTDNERTHVYSSDSRLSLKQQRLAKEDS